MRSTIGSPIEDGAEVDRSYAGPGAALLAAILFGGTTPFAKLLLGSTSPFLLAGLLYLGSGVGMSILSHRRGAKAREAPLDRANLPWLAGAILFGGIAAPALLMFGLRAAPASETSLLLSLEGVLTALIAWFVFRESFDRRILLGMAAIVGGGVVLSWPSGSAPAIPWAPIAIAAACLCWAIDNNLTQKISARDPVQVAAIKGTVAGTVNLGLAFALGTRFPPIGVILGSLLLGWIGYGLSLALYVRALRHIGAARTGAYFSVAPFIGAGLAIPLLGESVGPRFFVASALMCLGVWLHLTERHAHEHTHDRLEHSHSHTHDGHHQHVHPPGMDVHEPHAHLHAHEPVTHTHSHFPDTHHRHRHHRPGNAG